MNFGLALWLPPLVAVAFLAGFARILWPWQDKSRKDKGESTERHSERIYKNFEFFVSVTLAIVAGMGYLRFEKYDKARIVGEQAMHGLGMLELAVATSLSLFIIIHQGSKIRRWKNVEWEKWPVWLELWMCVSIMIVGSGIWVVSRVWS